MNKNTGDGELGDKVFDLAMKFAKDCGEQALGERNIDKIKEIYKRFTIDIQMLFINQLAQEANKAVDQAKNFYSGYDRAIAEDMAIRIKELLTADKESSNE